MEPETLPQAGMDEAAEDQVSPGTEDVAKLRQEAARWRTKLRDTEKTLNELKPLAEQFKATQDAQKSEAQKALEERDAARAEVATAKAEAARAVQEAKLTRLATKAGVDPDVAALLDLSKLDLDDEKAALETLGKLANARQTANSASNPARNGAAGPSEDELRQYYFGGGRNKPTIFGG